MFVLMTPTVFDWTRVFVWFLVGYRKFFYATIHFVYGQTQMPATEESICNPTGFYSITKRAAEQLIISYCETYGIKYRILRLCNVYGIGDTKFSKMFRKFFMF